MDEKRVKQKFNNLYEIINIVKNSPFNKDLFRDQMDLIKSRLKLLEYEIFQDISILGNEENNDEIDYEEDEEENKSGFPLIGQIDDDIIID